MKILFLLPYPLQEAPSQRFRFEQYFSLLEQRGFQWKVQSFLNSQNWRTFYNSGNLFSKISALTGGFIKRMLILFQLSEYDYIFIHREAAPIGPPVFEWIIARLAKRKVIYDFDDAIWLTDKTTESKIEKWVRWRSKVNSICKWSYKVSCGNQYLVDQAKQFNSRVTLNPTTIDTEHLHNPALYDRKLSDSITIGWTGSHSTLKYLDEIVPVIELLETKYLIRFLVIANQKPTLPLNSMVFIPWSAATEIKDLMQLDIGIMPLPDDVWAKGKCGFKALQYMALEVPALASPVGVNTQIIEDGINGYLCNSQEEWLAKLEYLIINSDKRIALGKQGRNKVESNYSVSSNSSNFLSLFE